MSTGSERDDRLMVDEERAGVYVPGWDVAPAAEWLNEHPERGDLRAELEPVEVTMTMTAVGFRCLERRAARLGMSLSRYVYEAFMTAEFVEEREREGAQVAFEMPDGTTDRSMWFFRCSSGGMPSGPCLAKMGVWCWAERPDDDVYEACGCGVCFVRKADLEAAGCSATR